ncbi:MAG: CAF17-like 4Fe-4S cluster assembly/insertion protein YgfZ [Pseudomonadota bacterium]
MEERFCLALAGRGLIEVAGEDRKTFLQGLISNDVTRVDGTRAIYAGLLTAQGRFLHDFIIAEMGASLYLDCESPRLDDLRKHLSIYRLRSKVTLSPAPDLAVAALWGPGALAALGLAEEPGRALAMAGGLVFVDPRLAEIGARAIVPRGRIGDLAALGFAPGRPEDYEQLRLALGLPDGSRDLPVEQALLLENGFEELNGLDWKKGCYVGQELTARMKYRALVRKRLLPVRIDGPTPAAGTPVMLGAEEAGEMRSAAGARGLALLRLEAVEQAARQGTALTAGAGRLTPLKPAWARDGHPGLAPT